MRDNWEWGGGEGAALGELTERERGSELCGDS